MHQDQIVYYCASIVEHENNCKIVVDRVFHESKFVNTVGQHTQTSPTGKHKRKPTMKLLTIGTNAKTVKSDKASEYLTAIMYLAPADTVAGVNLCPMAVTAGCRDACLYTAGRGAFSNVQNARIRKTEFFRDNRDGFMRTLVADIEEAQKKASKIGKMLAVRLNGTSDIAWENIRIDGATLFEIFPDVQFYDYTKLPNRRVPANYNLTISYSEANLLYAAKALKSDKNWAVVFSDKNRIPAEFHGRQVIDGDETDLRFLDAAGVVVGLYAKGQAKKDCTGFVVQV
jgi:hypothetical protein